MPFNTIDLYVVQAPGVPSYDNKNGQNPDDFLYNMLGALPGSVPVKDLQDLIHRAHMEFFRWRRPIRNLIIAGHGWGEVIDLTDYGQPGKLVENGGFHIGTSLFTADLEQQTLDNIHALVALRPVFAPDAHVFLLTCRVGACQGLLRRISLALGVPVHAYDNYVTATNYLLFRSTSDETDDDNNEVICWPNGDCKIIAPGEDRDRNWEPMFPGIAVTRK